MILEKCSYSFDTVYCDTLIYDYTTAEPLFVSIYDRSVGNVRMFASNVMLGKETMQVRGERGRHVFRAIDPMAAKYTQIRSNYENVCHGIVWKKNIENVLIGFSEEALMEGFYQTLLRQFPYPILPEWKSYFFEQAKNDRKLRPCLRIITLDRGKIVKVGEEEGVLDNLVGFKIINVSDAWVLETIKYGLETRKITISGQSIPAPAEQFGTVTEFMTRYGDGIVGGVKETLGCLSSATGYVENLLMKQKRLFPEQANNVEGIVKAMFKERSIILNMGMGTGKTLQSICSVEAKEVTKVRRATGKTVEEIYADSKLVQYRTAILCPSHMTQKWKREIENTIPYARAIVIEDLKSLQKAEAEMSEGKVFFIFSKDSVKLGYNQYPTPTKWTTKTRDDVQCLDSKCGIKTAWHSRSDLVCECGSKRKRVPGKTVSLSGVQCPECGEVIPDPHERYRGLGFSSFASRKGENEKCSLCGAKLWQPCVRNMGEYRELPWYSVRRAKNKAKQATVVHWVRKGKLDNYLVANGLKDDEVEEVDSFSARRCAPVDYVGKKMKGFFRYLIVDEAHQYKSGESSQGHALQVFISALEKPKRSGNGGNVLALTGTIAGGKADDLFYLLYRLCPREMKKLGYGWSDCTKFVQKYGTLESTYECLGAKATESNKYSRGRKVGSDRVLPGISLLLIPEILIGRTVYMDLSDMGAQLPNLKEKVVTVAPDNDVLREMNAVVRMLGSVYGNGLSPLSAEMLNIGLGYLDKPYDYGNILDPKTGALVCEPMSFPKYKTERLPKDEELLNIIEDELAEGRRCVVYCQYTGKEKLNCTDRLYRMIADMIGEKYVKILTASSPNAQKREEWMRQKALEGVKVFITNPKCVETGIDFIFEDDNGGMVTYPTIIFYQMGYSLYTLWQASRRHYRMNSRDEARTFYLAYGGTAQESVIRLMAEKQTCVGSLQGRFDGDAFTAMAVNVDPKILLVKEMLSGAVKNNDTAKIQGMFDKMNSNNFTRDWGDQRTRLFGEVFGDDKKEDILNELDDFEESMAACESTVAVTVVDLFDVFDVFDVDNVFDIFDTEEESTDKEEPILVQPVVRKRKTKRVEEGQLGFF